MAYVSISANELDRLHDAPDAIALLLRLRLCSWHRNTDGWIAPPAVRGAGAEMDLSTTKVRNLLARLDREEIVALQGGGWVRDLNYTDLHQTSSQRKADHERYARYNAKRRGKTATASDDEGDSPSPDHGGNHSGNHGGDPRGDHILSGAERSEAKQSAAELERSGALRVGEPFSDDANASGKGSPTTPPNPVSTAREENGALKPERVKILADMEANGETIPEQWAPKWTAWKENHPRGAEVGAL